MKFIFLCSQLNLKINNKPTRQSIEILKKLEGSFLIYRF